MNKRILPTILDLSEKWQISAKNIYFQNSAAWSEFKTNFLISFSPSHSLITNLLYFSKNELDLDLVKSVFLRCLELPDDLALLSNPPCYQLLDVFHSCNKQIKTSPIRDTSCLETGIWLQNKGLDPQLIYTRVFLNDVCYNIWRIYGKSDDDNDLEKKYLNWFADHSSCPFWKFQYWELTFFWCKQFQENLKILREKADLLHLTWIRTFKIVLGLFLPEVLVNLCLEFFRSL
jgi:hypothetical protein